MSDLIGKNALVTGASGGIGASSPGVSRLAGLRSPSTTTRAARRHADGVVAEIEAAGGEAVAVEGDVSDPVRRRRIVEESIAKLGGLDVVVNNAGITRDGLVVRMGDEEWNAVISTNLSGVFYVSRACAKYFMKQRSGSIVNIASVIGLVGNAGQANYAAAKAGVIGLTKSFAKELASARSASQRGCTGLHRDRHDGQASRGRRRGRTRRNRSAVDFGSPDDVAAAVAVPRKRRCRLYHRSGSRGRRWYDILLAQTGNCALERLNPATEEGGVLYGA